MTKTRFSVVALLWLSFAWVSLSPAVAADDQDTIVVINAGSSHTEVHAYRYRFDTNHSVPTIEEFYTDDSNLVFSNFESYPLGVVKAMKPLLARLQQHVPPGTPVNVMATAGMRVVSVPRAAQIMKHAKVAIKKSRYFIPGNVEIISGQDEAIFGWLSVNYALGRLNQSNQDTVGVLDMGGGSLEIAFATNQNNLPDTTQITIANQQYSLFSKSFLGLGQNSAASAITNKACYPDQAPLLHNQFGQFDYRACETDVETFIRSKQLPEQVPQTEQQTFIAMSGFYYVMDFFSAVEQPAQLSQQVESLCQQDWPTLQATYPFLPEKILKNECFYGVYNHQILKTGFHDLVGRGTVIPVKKLNGMSIDWTIGAALSLITEFKKS